MVYINLLPEVAVQAQRAYRRTRWLLGIAGSCLSVVVLLFLLQISVSVSGARERAQIETLAFELQTLHKAQQSREHELATMRSSEERRSKQKGSQSRIARTLEAISGLIPVNVTLSALDISGNALFVSGVAATRSDVAELVSAIKIANDKQEVRVENLDDTVVGRHTLHTFKVRAVVASANEKPREARDEGDVKVQMGEAPRS